MRQWDFGGKGGCVRSRGGGGLVPLRLVQVTVGPIKGPVLASLFLL